MFPRKKKENNHKERELPGFVNVTVIIIINFLHHMIDQKCHTMMFSHTKLCRHILNNKAAGVLQFICTKQPKCHMIVL